jgi:hypothetical protein
MLWFDPSAASEPFRVNPEWAIEGLTRPCRNSMFGKSSITIQKQTARFCPEKRFSGTDSIRLRQDDLQLTAERNGEATAP